MILERKTCALGNVVCDVISRSSQYITECSPLYRSLVSHGGDKRESARSQSVAREKTPFEGVKMGIHTPVSEDQIFPRYFRRLRAPRRSSCISKLHLFLKPWSSIEPAFESIKSCTVFSPSAVAER